MDRQNDYIKLGASNGYDPECLFDAAWYSQQYTDVATAGVDPLGHYFSFGAFEGRDPNSLFDTSWYLSQYQDVAAAKDNALLHYVLHGAAEGRNPNPLFDSAWYLSQYSSQLAGSNPLQHYLRYGANHGFFPNPLFDSAWYLTQHPDVRAANHNPLFHYIRFGAAEGRNPHPLFDSAWYLKNNADVAASGENPLYHYLAFGGVEGRSPHPLFDPALYLSQCPGASGTNLLLHFLRHGGANRAKPHGLFDSEFYLAHDPAVAASGQNPLLHFLVHGAAARAAPNAAFDTGFYVDHYPDVVASGLNPLVHYLTLGGARNYQPNVAFNADEYREAHPELWASAMLPLVHWLRDSLPTEGGGTVDALARKKHGVTGRLRQYCAMYHEASALPIVEEAFEIANRGATGSVPGAQASPEFGELLARVQKAHARKPASTASVVTIVIVAKSEPATVLSCLWALLSMPTNVTFETVICIDAAMASLRTALASMGNAVRLVDYAGEGDALSACNTVGENSHSRALVYLRDDAIVLPHWLDAIMTVLNPAASVGCVGSKLLCADGRVREAGMDQTDEGSVAAFGIAGDPSAPQFNTIRDIAGASPGPLAIDLATWAALDGLDTRLASLEDALFDFEGRVRAAGKRIVYQPLSAAILLAADGDAAASEVSAARIGRRLSAPSEAGQDPKHGSFSRPHILIMDHTIPQPDRDAGSRSMQDYINLFVASGFRITFWPLNQTFDRDYAIALQQMGIETLYRWDGHALSFDVWLKRNAATLDYAFVSRPNVAMEFIDPLRQASGAKILFYGHDVHFKRLEREYTVTGRPEARSDMIECERIERLVWPQCDAVYYPADDERDLVRQLCPEAKVHTIPLNIINQALLDETYGRLRRGWHPVGKRVMFVGGFRHSPNRDAVLWFMGDVWPSIVRAEPEAKLDIVGSFPPAEIQRFAGGNVSVTGAISAEALDHHYRAASVAIAPLRYGAGLKGKVLEALSYGVPLVCTNVAMQGITPAAKIAEVSDDRTEFAAMVIERLRNPDPAISLAGLSYLMGAMSEKMARAVLSLDIPEMKTDNGSSGVRAMVPN